MWIPVRCGMSSASSRSTIWRLPPSCWRAVPRRSGSFPIIDVLFEQQQTWTQNPREELLKIARMAGFTTQTFDQCLQNEDIAKGILDIRTTADQQYGVNSTPTFFINGEVIQGNRPLQEFRQAIEQAGG
jgi:protein-disulfide isomerase